MAGESLPMHDNNIICVVRLAAEIPWIQNMYNNIIRILGLIAYSLGYKICTWFCWPAPSHNKTQPTIGPCVQFLESTNYLKCANAYAHSTYCKINFVLQWIMRNISCKISLYFIVYVDLASYWCRSLRYNWLRTVHLYIVVFDCSEQ